MSPFQPGAREGTRTQGAGGTRRQGRPRGAPAPPRPQGQGHRARPDRRRGRDRRHLPDQPPAPGAGKHGARAASEGRARGRGARHRPGGAARSARRGARHVTGRSTPVVDLPAVDAPGGPVEDRPSVEARAARRRRRRHPLPDGPRRAHGRSPAALALERPDERRHRGARAGSATLPWSLADAEARSERDAVRRRRGRDSLRGWSRRRRLARDRRSTRPSADGDGRGRVWSRSPAACSPRSRRTTTPRPGPRVPRAACRRRSARRPWRRVARARARSGPRRSTCACSRPGCWRAGTPRWTTRRGARRESGHADRPARGADAP